MEKTYRKAVREAALYMDGVKPDWWQRIDPLRLDLSDCARCVCGQNELKWTHHFFPGPDLTDLAIVTSNREYEPLWLEEIASRMPDSARLDRVVVERATKPADGRVRSGGRTE